MPKVATYAPINHLSVNRQSDVPLHRQLYEQLRYNILNGTFRPGMRLPSTRALAQQLAVSRNTVSSTFSQLRAEGYIESQVGSGTHVTRTLPEDILHVDQNINLDGYYRTHPPHQDRHRPERPVTLSEQGQAIANIPYSWELPRSASFNSAMPSLDGFPFKEWERLLSNAWRELSANNGRHLGYTSARGYLPLREALAHYLQTARGATCSADNIIITNGAQQAVTLTANLLLNRGDPVWVENPCYAGIRAALSGVLAQSIPVPVDQDGLDVSAGIALAPNARLVYVSPSHQYPLGVTMSLTRRLQLLQWAADNDAWIVEDDYDSEYRYAGYPIPAVQGLDQHSRVIYVGTFSKVLFPALRIGYLILPTPLVEPFHAARAHADRGSSLLEQAVLAKFIANGQMARHIRRLRTQYATHQAMIVAEIEARLGDDVKMSGTDAGLHFVLWLPDGVDDAAVSAELNRHNISAPALSSFALKPLKQGGLVLGFAALSVDEIIPSVQKLCAIVK